MAGKGERLVEVKHLIAFIYQASRYGSTYIALCCIAVLAHYFVGKPPAAHLPSVIASYLAVGFFGLAFIGLFLLATYDFLERRSWAGMIPAQAALNEGIASKKQTVTTGRAKKMKPDESGKAS